MLGRASVFASRENDQIPPDYVPKKATPWWLIVILLYFFWASGLFHGGEKMIDHARDQLDLLRNCSTLQNCCGPEAVARAEGILLNLRMVYWRFSTARGVLVVLVLCMAVRALWFRELPWWVRVLICVYVLYVCLWRVISGPVT